MSAYMLRDEDYQLIADWLLEHGNDTGSDHCYDIRKFIGIDPYSDEIRTVSTDDLTGYIKSMMRSLYDLNRIAMVTRYGENWDREDKTQFTPKNRFYNISSKEAIQKMKSLRYQCAEYIASETKLFDKLSRFIGILCENLFSNQELVKSSETYTCGAD
jgi:hypothetical protein